jgi:hypothetical protein
MNIFAAKKNEKRYNYLMYLSIFLAPITGTLSAISSNEHYDTLQILITTFSFLSGIISGIIKYSEFGEKSLSYKTIASKYASLEMNIRRQLSLPKQDRVNAGEYLEWITSSFDDLFSTAPLISDDIYSDWVSFAKDKNLNISKDIKNFEKVAVWNEESGYEKKLEEIKTESSIENNSVESNVENKELEQTKIDITTQHFLDGKIKYEMHRLARNK